MEPSGLTVSMAATGVTGGVPQSVASVPRAQ